MPIAVSHDLLLDYIKEKGYASDIIKSKKRGGSFDPEEKVITYDPTDKIAAVHESVHALQRAPGRTAKINDYLMSMDQDEVKDLAVPAHWKQGGFEDPQIVGLRRDFQKWQHPFIKQAAMDAAIKHGETVANSFSPKETRSGFTKKDYSGHPGFANVAREAQAYYGTEPDVATPKDRRKSLGLFLRDKNVPWEIIDPLLKELGL